MGKRVTVIGVGVLGFVMGLLASQGLPQVLAQGAAKGPSWTHGLELRVRRAGEADFNKDTRKYGIEVFKDENNGNLIYISETGAIAVVPGK